ncbi:MAG TPA: tRNA (adenosine(37)-N6)-dimethylallyltransferase MiaA [Actinomycetota bacterium]|nr:tRNA (adenosine(37)-N6)-dimethylallyltransferase MiaA [Actinomycetota bacterium]
MTDATRRPLLGLVGPTASGKTRASLAIAVALDAEIVCVDSMLVYRGMDVGTAKPAGAERAAVRHHLIDVAEPDERFSVARFQRLAAEALTAIAGRGRTALLVGGSGLYYRAVVDGLAFPATDPAVRVALETEAVAVGAAGLHRRLAAFDPAAAAKIEPGNVRRTVRALEVAAITGRTFSSFAAMWEAYPAERVRAAGIEIEPAALAARIESRARAMFEGGLLEEARGLAEAGLGEALTARQAIGYQEALAHLDGQLSLEEAVARTVRRTRELARRQMAWFRRDPRIRWFRTGAEGGSAVADELREYLAA